MKRSSLYYYSTQIVKKSYCLGESEDVQITLYDLTGKMEQLLLQSKHTSGHYHYKQDISNYTSGLYLCKIQIGNKEAITRKVFL